MNSAQRVQPMTSKTLKPGDKLTIEGQRARIHSTRPDSGTVIVRWLETGSYSKVDDDVLADSVEGWADPQGN